MKKILFILIIVLVNKLSAQQSFSTSFIRDIHSPTILSKDTISKSLRSGRLSFLEIKNASKNDSKLRDSIKTFRKNYLKQLNLNLPVFGIEGIGNLNQEALKSINASGKISFYTRPVQFRNNALTIYASYNKNASNNDSVLYQKIIFPDIGSNSFTGTVELNKFWKKESSQTLHSLSPFFEFAYKNIGSDSSAENQKLNFTALNYTAGLKYIFGYSKLDKNDTTKNNNLSFFAIPYLSLLNVPNEDLDDYRALLTRKVKLSAPASNLTDNICTWGFKIGFQVNGLQIFADFRSVLNKDEHVPLRELKGFHANIGVSFNADVLEFRK